MFHYTRHIMLTEYSEFELPISMTKRQDNPGNYMDIDAVTNRLQRRVRFSRSRI